MEKRDGFPGKTIGPGYHDVQYLMDKMIGKYGLKKTVEMLSNFALSDQFIPGNGKAQLFASHLITEAISHFDLEESLFLTSRKAQYRNGRMTCYHLYLKYTAHSYEIAAKAFGTGKRNIIYYKNKVEERLSVPSFYKAFTKAYDKIEERVIHYIAQL